MFVALYFAFSNHHVCQCQGLKYCHMILNSNTIYLCDILKYSQVREGLLYPGPACSPACPQQKSRSHIYWHKYRDIIERLYFCARPILAKSSGDKMEQIWPNRAICSDDFSNQQISNQEFFQPEDGPRFTVCEQCQTHNSQLTENLRVSGLLLFKGLSHIKQNFVFFKAADYLAGQTQCPRTLVGGPLTSSAQTVCPAPQVLHIFNHFIPLAILRTIIQRFQKLFVQIFGDSNFGGSPGCDLEWEVDVAKRDPQGCRRGGQRAGMCLLLFLSR